MVCAQANCIKFYMVESGKKVRSISIKIAIGRVIGIQLAYFLEKESFKRVKQPE